VVGSVHQNREPEYGASSEVLRADLDLHKQVCITNRVPQYTSQQRLGRVSSCSSIQLGAGSRDLGSICAEVERLKIICNSSCEIQTTGQGRGTRAKNWGRALRKELRQGQVDPRFFDKGTAYYGIGNGDMTAQFIGFAGHEKMISCARSTLRFGLDAPRPGRTVFLWLRNELTQNEFQGYTKPVLFVISAHFTSYTMRSDV